MTLRPARRATVALVAAVLLALPACSGGSTSSVADQGFISGDGTVTQLAVAKRKDPVEFSGTTLAGKPFDLKALRGDVVVVNVWASWCAPCRQEHPLLMELAKDPGIRLVGINYKDNPENARRFLGALGNPFAAVGADPNGRAAIDWGVYGVPETFVIGPDGTIRHKQIGPLTPEAMDGFRAMLRQGS